MQSFDAEAAHASAAREAGRIAEAVQAYRAALRIQPDWEEGWWYLGTLNYDADRFAEAIPALETFARLEPSVGAGWAFLGLSEYETAAYGQAFIHLQRAQNLGFADDPEVEKVAIYHLALLLNLRGDFETSAHLLIRTFGSGHLPDQIKNALGLALLRVPLLPAQVDPARDSVLHAAGETADLLARPDVPAANRAFQQMLKDFPQTPYLHYAYGLALMSDSRYDAAEAQFRDEALVTPHSASSNAGMSALNLKRGRIEDAVANARAAVQLDPDSSEAYWALAQSLQEAKQDDQAMTALNNVTRLSKDRDIVDPAQRSFYAVNRDAQHPEDSQSSAIRPPTKATATGAEDFDALARQATAARDANRIGEAVVLYERGVQKRPTWQEGWRQLGTLFYMEQNFSEASAALKHAVALDARQADTWTLLGLCEFESKDFKNALLHLKKGQALGFGGNPAGVRYARYHLALLLNLEGEFDPATDLLIPEARNPGPLSDEIQFAMGLALLRMPIMPDQVDPSKRELVRSAGRAAALLSESRYDSAFPIFEKLLQEYPNTPFLHYAYGDALSATSDYDRAQTQLREEIRNNPNSLIVYLRLTAIALRLNQPETALDSAKKAVSLAAESADAHYLLGRSYLEFGDAPSAISELETARRLAPSSPAVHFNLARAYAKAKRPEDARQERAEFERLNALLSPQPGGQHISEDRAGTAIEGQALAPSVSK